MGKYIYCVTDYIGSVIAKGIDNSAIHLITHKDISAVVSDVAFEELDPTDENLLAHEKINQSIIFDYKHNATPMAFCTIVKREEDVAKILREGYYTFKKNLLLVKNKFELAVKVFCDIDKLKSFYGGSMYDASKEIAQDMFNRIKKISADSKLNDLIIDNMILNATFLVDRQNLDSFNSTIKDIDDVHGDKLLIRIGGPMAAYSFVKMPDESRL
jgi:YesN/AraC family two-component response regulator